MYKEFFGLRALYRVACFDRDELDTGEQLLYVNLFESELRERRISPYAVLVHLSGVVEETYPTAKKVTYDYWPKWEDDNEHASYVFTLYTPAHLGAAEANRYFEKIKREVFDCHSPCISP